MQVLKRSFSLQTSKSNCCSLAAGKLKQKCFTPGLSLQVIPFMPQDVFQHAQWIFAFLPSLFLLCCLDFLPLSYCSVCAYAGGIRAVPWSSPQLIPGAKHAGGWVAARASSEHAAAGFLCLMSVSLCADVFLALQNQAACVGRWNTW